MKTKEIDFKAVDVSKVNLSEEDKKLSLGELIAPIFINALVGYVNQNRGLFKTERTLFYSLHPTLENMIKDKKDTAEVTDQEFGFIRKCFEAKLPPTSMLEAVENYLETLNR